MNNFMMQFYTTPLNTTILNLNKEIHLQIL